MLVELHRYLFTFNLCLTAVCLFLLKFYLLIIIFIIIIYSRILDEQVSIYLTRFERPHQL